MGETIKVSDLTRTEVDPTERADVGIEKKPVKFTAKFKMPSPLGGASAEIDLQTPAGSRLASAVTALLLTVSGCFALAAAVGAKAAGVNVPTWAFLASLLLPVGIYVLVSFGGGHGKE